MLRRFRAVRSHFPAGNIIPSESPDFILQGSESALGIELTELFVAPGDSASPPQAVESARSRVLALAKEIMSRSSDPSLAVSVHFRHFWQPIGRDLSSLAQRLVHIVQREGPLAPGISVELADGDERLSEVHDAVVSVTILSPPIAADHFWMAPGFAWMAPLERAALAEVITAKEELFPRYLSKVNRAWLVLVFRSSRLSSAFTFDPVSIQPLFSSCFERIYLFDDFRRQTWLLSRPAMDAA